MLVGEGPH
ncbi:Protein of unknown function [Bacillus wiedmannii]|uniref:Uncharacterized protein n=1 Tax=Bacillus wiedmannii TaxID=1890302 RepID=A0A1C4CBA3_9BACI|nr:Protein of unknown function [Bacillus wiedmannii]